MAKTVNVNVVVEEFGWRFKEPDQRHAKVHNGEGRIRADKVDWEFSNTTKRKILVSVHFGKQDNREPIEPFGDEDLSEVIKAEDEGDIEERLERGFPAGSYPYKICILDLHTGETSCTDLNPTSDVPDIEIDDS